MFFFVQHIGRSIGNEFVIFCCPHKLSPTDCQFQPVALAPRIDSGFISSEHTEWCPAFVHNNVAEVEQVRNGITLRGVAWRVMDGGWAWANHVGRSRWMIMQELIEIYWFPIMLSSSSLSLSLFHVVVVWQFAGRLWLWVFAMPRELIRDLIPWCFMWRLVVQPNPATQRQ